MKSHILTHHEIQHKIKRMAYQIYETFSNENKVILLGIANSGFIFSKLLMEELQIISDLQIENYSIALNKQNPSEEVICNTEINTFNMQNVVVVDDVLNSGATLIYAVKHILQVPVKNLKTAVLIDRNHKKYPVKADFKGLSLSTSLQENVQVVFNKDNYEVTLS
jgi:pyrimidine operon attenuation protein / uracil phosphoribosyltransferase